MYLILNNDKWRKVEGNFQINYNIKMVQLTLIELLFMNINKMKKTIVKMKYIYKKLTFIRAFFSFFK